MTRRQTPDSLPVRLAAAQPEAVSTSASVGAGSPRRLGGGRRRRCSLMSRRRVSMHVTGTAGPNDGIMMINLTASGTCTAAVALGSLGASGWQCATGSGPMPVIIQLQVQLDVQVQVEPALAASGSGYQCASGTFT